MNRNELAKEALKAALTTRRDCGLRLDHPVCAFDLVERLGVELRFVDIPSLEGMYVNREPPLILVGTHRPTGRQVFTCAHELGHHVFGHGTKATSLVPEVTTRWDPQEFLADVFAGYLLMPKLAVRKSFLNRGWKPTCATPADVYRVATWLGVGYETLITHLFHSLHLISNSHREDLLRVTPKRIKSELVGQSIAGEVVVVDHQWCSRPIDLSIGDYVLAPFTINYKKPLLASIGRNEYGYLFQAQNTGISELEADHGVWTGHVRIQRKRYVGRSIFRHLEDVPDE